MNIQIAARDHQGTAMLWRTTANNTDEIQSALLGVLAEIRESTGKDPRVLLLGLPGGKQ